VVEANVVEVNEEVKDATRLKTNSEITMVGNNSNSMHQHQGYTMISRLHTSNRSSKFNISSRLNFSHNLVHNKDMCKGLGINNTGGRVTVSHQTTVTRLPPVTRRPYINSRNTTTLQQQCAVQVDRLIKVASDQRD
jgi:hypothetical protein